MKYNVTVGSHSAQVSLNPPDASGMVVGTISHTQYGDGAIAAKQTGDSLSGTVNLGGHNATFTAQVSGKSISGTITPTGFLSIMGSASFSGSAAA